MTTTAAWECVRLGSYRAGEVNFVPNDQVRLPGTDEFDESRSPTAGDSPAEALPDHPLFGEAVDGHERTPLGRSEQRRSTGREDTPPFRGDSFHHRLLTSVCDFVAASLERPGERRGGEEVPAAAHRT